MKQVTRTCLLLCALFLLPACAPKAPAPDHPAPQIRLDDMQFSIQAGAFAVLDNAVSLMQHLELKGLQAYYFRDSDGLYKVRFGNFSTYQQASDRARQLFQQGLLQEFFVVVPDSYAVARFHEEGSQYIRQRLVTTAHQFIGVPYRWGGSSPEYRFDCSGLTMVVYRHNGLNLPRVAARQYQAGTPVSRSLLQKGDLVFFDTRGKGSISHVGVYIGDGQFIHAPSSGRNVTRASLSSPYFSSRYIGARTYL